MLRKPSPEDIPSFQQKYVDRCPSDILSFLARQKDQFLGLIRTLDPDDLKFRYAPGKWTLREVIMHVIDTEQIFNYRALAILRGEKQTLPGFDQDAYVSSAHLDHIQRGDLETLFESTRNYSIAFYRLIHNDEWDIRGKISDYSMTLQAMPYMVGGHLAHHLAIIEERYLST